MPDAGGFVEVTNIGPIDRLCIPIVAGRITVLTGANGAGKSQAIAAVEKALSNRGRLSTSDVRSKRIETMPNLRRQG